jgi:hypothetical protein
MSLNPFASSSSTGENSVSDILPSASSSSSSSSSFKFANLLPSSSTSLTSNSSDSSSMLSSPVVLFIVVLLFAFVGFNIFTYFAKGLDAVSNILKPVFSFFIALFAQIFNVSAEGAKQATVTTTTAAQKAVTSAVNNTKDLSTAMNQTSSPPKQDEIQADDALSSIQGGGKQGWCYIGMEKGYRSCASVEASDQCMSGDIFPTQEVCVNPSLRV